MEEVIIYVEQYCQCGHQILDSTQDFKVDEFGEVIECEDCNEQ
jgi:hypothetical protein